MGLYQLARKVNAKRKAFLKAQAGKIISPVRRIEQVFPPKDGRYVAMTFDDGPDALQVEGRQEGLTQVILEELARGSDHVTFDVIGSTAGNYPDTKGEAGTFMWSGNAFDHYPCFGRDELGGAKNRPELVESMLSYGHEISNHGSTHTLFGRMRAVYGARHHFDTLSQVVGDLQDLHSYMRDNFGYEMRLGRPAHYIDKIPDGSDAYDAYRIMGYNYMAASFDGAGWQPLPTYQEEVEAMVSPLEKALSADPEALNGKIIFQKDGCSMSLRTPIADALPRQLKLLHDLGYKVVSVSELLDMSPFEDLDPSLPQTEDIKYLLERGHAVGYKNNTFGGERPLTEEELYIMLAPSKALRKQGHMGVRELYSAAREAVNIDLPQLTGNGLLRAVEAAGAGNEELSRGLKDKKSLTRLEAVPAIAAIVRAMER